MKSKHQRRPSASASIPTTRSAKIARSLRCLTSFVLDSDRLEAHPTAFAHRLPEEIPRVHLAFEQRFSIQTAN